MLLDAACGISHPFKFALAEVSREVHACDIDPRITSRSQILEDIARDFGLDAAQRQASDWQHRLHLAHANLADLPYDREKFDRVFCISVLEHMTPEDQSAAIGEFYRTLKPGGLLVLTFDYPAVHLENIQQTLQQAGFTFAGRPISGCRLTRYIPKCGAGCTASGPCFINLLTPEAAAAAEDHR